MGSFFVDNPPPQYTNGGNTLPQPGDPRMQTSLPPNYHLPGGPNLNPQGPEVMDSGAGGRGGATGVAPQGGQGDPKAIALAYAQSLGPPTPENIQKTADYMKSQGFNVQANPGSDGFFINGVGVDMVSNFHGQGPSNWQWLPDSPIGGSGGGDTGGGGYGYPGGTGLTPTQQIEQTPGYQFSVDQAMNAIQHSAAARGTLLSGGLMKNLGSYIANSVAGPAYQQQVQNLYGIAGLGQNAAALTGNAGAAYGRSAGDLITGIGNAQAAGQVGSANATAAGLNGVGNAINTGIGYHYGNPDPYGRGPNPDPFAANASGYSQNGVNNYGVTYTRPS